MRFVALFALCALSVLTAEGFTFKPEENLAEVGASYFAPAGSFSWRARLPGRLIRYFSCEGEQDGAIRLKNPEGWTGRIEGESVTLVPPVAERQGLSVQEYQFRNGTLVKLVQGGESSTFDYPELFPSPGEVPPLLKVRDDYRPEELDIDIWRGTGRLRLGYRNPNCLGALLAELAVLALAVLLKRRWMLRIAGGAGLALCLVLMGRTESRAALLAFGMAACAFAVLRGGSFLRAMTWRRALGGLLLFLAVAGVLYFGYRDRFAQFERNIHSDRGRLEATDKVLQMMACAPGGWNETAAGMTYTMWFQDFEKTWLVRDMMNEHLTFLVMHAWPVRFAYLFAWLGILAVLFAFSRRGGSPACLGIWIVQGVTAALNRTYVSPTLWILPAGVLLFALMRADWRRDRRLYLGHLALAAALSAVLLVGVQILGSRLAAGDVPRIHSDGKHVLINGRSPRHWIVDEPSILNPTFTGKDIRLFYRDNPDAPAVGYVRELDDVPAGAGHLTLFGRSCARFVERFRKSPSCSLPERVTFISPTLPPEEIPEDLVRTCRLRVIAGAFLVRYWTTDMDWRAPSWLTIVPGAEIYIPDWMRFCVK